MTLDEECIEKVEQEVDNVAPKVIAILGLSKSCDTALLKQQLIDYCDEYRESLIGNKKKKTEENEEIPEENLKSLRAHICPPAGSSSNLGSKKQRLIFLEIDRDDVYSVLDAGKVADMVLMAMSAQEADESLLKVDPEKYSGAIDEQGYKALALLRTQGMATLLGVL